MGYFNIDYTFSHFLDIENSVAPNVDEIRGKIYYNDHSRSSILAGMVELHYYNNFNDTFTENGFGLLEAFDRSASTIGLGEVIFDFNTDNMIPELEEKIGISWNSNVLVVHQLMLLKSFRNKGYGKEIISGIENFFTGRCGYLALQSYPRQHDLYLKGRVEFQEYDLGALNADSESAQVSLDRFYLKCGFHKIEDKDGSFFIKNINPM